METDILLARGPTGSYWWSPIIQTVRFIPWRHRRPTWEGNLIQKENNLEGAYKKALTHALRLVDLA